MLPPIASSMSLSVGLGISDSSTAALMICPDWQYPHCGTSSSIHAFCSGCVRSGESPSIVVTCFPATRETGATHERIAFPSKCTVHAPQSAIPQPNLVPVSPSDSRRAHNKGVDGSTSTWTAFPFTKKLVICGSPALLRMATLVSLGWWNASQGYVCGPGLQIREDSAKIDCFVLNWSNFPSAWASHLLELGARRHCASNLPAQP